MRRLIIIWSALFALISPAVAADSTLTALPTNASAFSGTELVYVIQGAADRKGTPAQFATYIYGLASGDCTISSVGAVVCTKTNGVAFTALATTAPGTGIATALGVNVGTAGSVVVNGGALGTPSSGTATNLTGTAAGLTAGNVTTNANLTGMVTSVGNAASLGSFTSANLAGALTDETGTGANVFAGSPALTGTPTAPTATVGTNTTQLATTAFVIANAGSGAVSSVTGGTGITVSPTTGAVVVSVAVTQRNNTTTSDTIVAGDAGTAVTESNASAVAVAIAQAGTTGFASGQYWTLKNKGAGLVTIQPTTSQIDGASTLTVKQNQSVDFYSDGTNYWSLPGRPTNVAASDLVGIGTNVAAAVNTTLSAAGGLTSTIASGTATGGTSAIASAACGTVITVSAPNTATTDVVTVGFNGDPTAITGFIPATAGMLSIIAYPTSGNINIKECNNTSASITPGAHTYNWRVVR